MRNPLVEARETVGLTRAAFARKHGLPYTVVANAELGYHKRPSEQLLRALEKEGFDPGELARRYAEWRRQQIETV